MIKLVVSVYDIKSHIYMQPFMVNHEAQAIRMVQTEVNREDKENNLHVYSEDFELYKLAEFDEETGKYTNYDNPVPIVRCDSLKK